MMTKTLFKETDLELDLKELSSEILRELFITSKKIAIYNQEHPQVELIMQKPFYYLEKLFRVKNYWDLKVAESKLLACGLACDKSIFVSSFLSEFKRLKVQELYITSQVSSSQLSSFLFFLFSRLARNPSLTDFLAENKISSIFTTRPQKGVFFSTLQPTQSEESYRKVKNQIQLLLRFQSDFLLDIFLKNYKSDLELEKEYRSDFHLLHLRAVAPLELLRLAPEELIALLKKRISHYPAEVSYTEGLRNLIRVYSQHPEQKTFFGGLAEAFEELELSQETLSKSLDETAKIKIKVFQEADKLVTETLPSFLAEEEKSKFDYIFPKLLTLNEESKLKALLEKQLFQLTAEDINLHRAALEILKQATGYLVDERTYWIFDFLVQRILQGMNYKSQNLKFYQEILDFLANTLIDRKQFGPWTQIVKKLSEIAFSKETEPETAELAKEIFENYEQDNNLELLISEILRKDKQGVKEVRECLVALSSKKVALRLSQYITHPERFVRQHILKILASMGETAGKVFSEILWDDTSFQRESDQITLIVESWFKVRNAIHILGRVRSDEAILAFKKRIMDPDFRVRKEIVKALERFKTQAALDLLFQLAGDPHPEVKSSSIIAIGLCGTPEEVHLLRDVFYVDKELALPVIFAVSNIGGETSKRFLFEILDKPKIYGGSFLEKVDEKQIKLTAARALAKIGDLESVQKVKSFKDTLTKTQKIFLGKYL